MHLSVPWRVHRSPGKCGVIQVSCCIQPRFQNRLPSLCVHRPTCPSGPDCRPRAAQVSGTDSEHPLRTRLEACLDNVSQELLMQPRVPRLFHSVSNSFLRMIRALWRDFSDGVWFQEICGISRIQCLACCRIASHSLTFMSLLFMCKVDLFC